MSQIIKPSIGRRVWFFPGVATLTSLRMNCNDPDQAMDAGVCYVYHDRMVNVSVTDHMGTIHAINSVTLIQPGDDIPEGRDYCTWMPYQVSQSAKEAKTDSAAGTTSTSNPIEAKILAKGLTAPRITSADIKANIVSEHYFTAAQGVDMADPEMTDANMPQPFKQLTFCVLMLRNGFTVTGESACASPENFNEEIGRSLAREKAVEKIGPLMGYELRSALHLLEVANRRDLAYAQAGIPMGNTEGSDYV